MRKSTIDTRVIVVYNLCKMKHKPIQFSKSHTFVARRILIEVISKLADVEGMMWLIDDLSLVLTVMNRCYEAAPDVPGQSVEIAEKESVTIETGDSR